MSEAPKFADWEARLAAAVTLSMKEAIADLEVRKGSADAQLTGREVAAVCACIVAGALHIVATEMGAS